MRFPIDFELREFWIDRIRRYPYSAVLTCGRLFSNAQMETNILYLALTRVRSATLMSLRALILMFLMTRWSVWMYLRRGYNQKRIHPRKCLNMSIVQVEITRERVVVAASDHKILSRLRASLLVYFFCIKFSGAASWHQKIDPLKSFSCCRGTQPITGDLYSGETVFIVTHCSSEMYELRLLLLQHTRINGHAVEQTQWLAENKAGSLQPCAVLNFCQASPEKAQETKRHCGNPDGFTTQWCCVPQGAESKIWSGASNPGLRYRAFGLALLVSTRSVPL